MQAHVDSNSVLSLTNLVQKANTISTAIHDNALKLQVASMVDGAFNVIVESILECGAWDQMQAGLLEKKVRLARRRTRKRIGQKELVAKSSFLVNLKFSPQWLMIVGTSPISEAERMKNGPSFLP